jgi:hypothetical protein
MVWGAITAATPISGGNLDAGDNALGAEIDNETAKNQWATVELEWTTSATSEDGEVIELYFLYAPDGTSYEDGGASEDPKKSPCAVFVNDGGTGAQNQAHANIPLSPHKFKPLLKSELSDDCTASSVTLKIETFS